MTRQDRTISIVVSPDQFDAIDLLGARYGLSPAEFLRRTAEHIATLSDGLAIHGRKTCQ